MKRTEVLQVLELSFVLVVTLAMLVYGLAKYVQFDNPSLITKSVSEMTGMELMWSFYGYSKTYAILLGIAEITGGILFLVKRTRILGGVLLTGILMNVIVQDIVYGVNQGALIAAIIYQIMVFSVLWMYKKQLIDGIKAIMVKKRDIQYATNKRLLLIGLAFIVALIWKFIEFKLTH